MKSIPLLVVLLAGTTGCYHATIETGATPSTEVIKKPWATGLIGGLVPPSTVETASKCTSGVARVETKLSFVNQLAAFLTLGIYTPMSIEVTCAAARSAHNLGQPEIEVGATSTAEARGKALAEAVNRSKESGKAVVVDFGTVQD